jgi:hypothetical protein
MLQIENKNRLMEVDFSIKKENKKNMQLSNSVFNSKCYQKQKDPAKSKKTISQTQKAKILRWMMLRVFKIVKNLGSRSGWSLG